MYSGGHFAEADEDELSLNPGSPSGDSDAIDSDVEDRILSHMYYRTADATGATSVPAPTEPPPAGAAEAGEEESKHNIKPAARGQASSLYGAAAAAPAAGPDAGSSSTEEDEEVTARDDTFVEDAHQSAAEPGREAARQSVPRPKIDVAEAAEGCIATSSGAEDVISPRTAMEQQVVRIDALLGSATLSGQESAVHPVAVTRARGPESDDEYGYLDEAEIQGRNRYFMEEKEIVCRKCKKTGHIAKDCTTVTCMVCGEEGHISKDCKLTGSVCHGCNMRGHMLSECPLRSGKRSDKRAPRASGCERCDSRSHHTEECATIWRRYVYTGPRPEQYSDVMPWCYNCAVDGHFGDDCRQPRARGATAFLGDTAFSAHNCPGKCLRGTAHPVQHHTPSSRGSPYDRGSSDRYRSTSSRDSRRSSPWGRKKAHETPTKYTSSIKHKRAGPKRPKQPAATPRKAAKGGDR
ncbi:hypothetical protein IWQ57_003136 [Coemansia nantahalensis]|uniref:Uncharacterized protein n=1 Tax=Coemansia nantahalensis TaxID=2789366 RepID=A0ACC1JXN8_9FUNG|nr:hypothetical protein IWQ57_003136 [Coemansia nantahalensis]